jgi:uncharacterized protein (TIGR01777 family)
VKVVIAGGTGALGRRLVRHYGDTEEVVVLTRRERPDLGCRQVVWDGRTVGPWADELRDAILINLAGELVARRATSRNIELLKTSRVEPTRALVAASRSAPPALWLQMSTLAIYGDAGDPVLDEAASPAAWPPQMADVATAWERALDGARAGRVVVMRTGVVLDQGTPALDHMRRIVRAGLGGRIASGQQWFSWLHVDDFLRAVDFLRAHDLLSGVVHVTSPNPVRNRELMAEMRHACHRPWSPPTPTLAVRLGALVMGFDPALPMTGRRGVPRRLLDAGFECEFPTLRDALGDLLADYA